jgi:hypothetical protein
MAFSALNYFLRKDSGNWDYQGKEYSSAAEKATVHSRRSE